MNKRLIVLLASLHCGVASVYAQILPAPIVVPPNNLNGLREPYQPQAPSVVDVMAIQYAGSAVRHTKRPARQRASLNRKLSSALYVNTPTRKTQRDNVTQQRLSHGYLR